MHILDKKIQLGTYLDFRRIKKFTYKYPIRIVVGSRGDGKSTSCKKWLEKEVYKNNRKFVWLCRTEDEIKLKKRDIFEKEFPNWRVIGNNVFDITKELIPTKKGSKEKVLSQILVGKILSINLASKYRSGNSFKDFDIILWDEFQDENERYVKDEMIKIFSIFESVLRTKTTADIWLMSNEVSKWCPLYDYLKIITQPKPNEILFIPNKKVAYCRTKTSDSLSELKAKSLMTAFSQDSDYKKFAYDNEWKNDNDNNIITNPRIMKDKFNIMYLNNHLGVYQLKNGIYISDKTNSGKTYPLTKSDSITHGLEWSNSDWFYSLAMSCIKSQTMFFNSGITKDIIISFVGK